MGWFDEQIRTRKEKDQEVFEDAFFEAAEAVLGRKARIRLDDERTVAKAAVDEILKYYHYKPREVPESIRDSETQLEYLLRPHGIMRRNVRLEGAWYRDAFGPMLGYLREGGTPVALLPRGIVGYSFRDPATGRSVRVNRRTAALLRPEAICFYHPLPLRRIGVLDLVRYLWSCLQLRDIALILLADLAVTLVGMLVPRLSRVLTGAVPESGSFRLLGAAAAFLLCAALASRILGTISAMLTQRITARTNLQVEAAMMMRLLSLPPGFFRRYSAGELTSRSQSVSQLCALIINTGISTSLVSLTSLLYLTQIFRFTPALAYPALGVIVVTVGYSVLSSLLQMRVTKAHMEHHARESGMSYAMISGVQKLKLAGAEKRAFARWAGCYAEGARLVYQPPLFLRLNSVIMTAITLVSTIVIYYFAVSSEIGVEDYFAFNAAYGMVFGAFQSLAGIALSVARIRPILEMAQPFLSAVPETAEDKEVLTSLNGSIELSQISFRYGPQLPCVLEGLSLKIQAGEYLGIVGPTGCGKSTLLRILLGFETPEKGAVYFDGRDISSVDLKSLRARIGVVLQNDGLFQGSIFDNIAIAAPALTLEEAWEAAELADIAEEIRAMPMGMQTVISEGHGGISGGQKQRLMIARAIAPKPRVLLFDEATSALDNRTQRRISEALDGLKCTRIVVAHRLSTVRGCDRILVMDRGRIVEEGSYDALMAQNGLFAELVARQQA